jgi:hypothetical protein
MVRRAKLDFDEWELWFAWRPVVLLGTEKVAWLRWIFRRSVLTKDFKPHYDYSEKPVRKSERYDATARRYRFRWQK